MGVHAARKAAEIVANVETVLAIELLAAAQALDFLAPLKGGRGVVAAHRALRKKVARLRRDRAMAPDIEKARALIESGALLMEVERAVGTLD